ncbi:hypothetical protein [Flavobacterium pedocola]
MEKRPEFKNILGLTQEEMAMLLRIPISQWKMFKSGKRGIPLDALKQLTFLLQGAQERKQTSKEVLQVLNAEEQKAKEKLKLDYLNIQIKQYRVKKELERVENHRMESIAALELVSFLEKQQEISVQAGLLLIIKDRALKTLHKHSLHKLEQLQLQKENYERLASRIEARLK